MLKHASGVAAKTVGPRGFLWAAMATAGLLILAAALFWWPGMMNIWLILNGVSLLLTAIATGVRSEDSDFECGNLNAAPTLWAVMGELMGSDSRASFARLLLWMLLTPLELALTCVVRLLALLVALLLRPMPGKW